MTRAFHLFVLAISKAASAIDHSRVELDEISIGLAFPDSVVPADRPTVLNFQYEQYRASSLGGTPQDRSRGFPFGL
jgi:hypothetical protein